MFRAFPIRQDEAQSAKTLFSDNLPTTTVRKHLARTSEESLRVTLELLWPYFPDSTWDRERPLLVLGAENDFVISPTMVKATAQVYDTRGDFSQPGSCHDAEDRLAAGGRPYPALAAGSGNNQARP